MKVAHLLTVVDDDRWKEVELNVWECNIRTTTHKGTGLEVR